MSAALPNPAKMIAKGAPRVIHSEDELEAYTDALFQLTTLEDPTASQEEAIELLTLLIEHYEREHHAIPAAEPVSVLRYLMEKQNLTQRDLIPEFGSESAVSMVMTGTRNLTLDQIRKLSIRFNLPTDIFIANKKPAVPAMAAKAARSR